MWLTPSALFWSSLGLIGYTYVGYPLTIYALSRLRRRKTARAPITPKVSAIIAAKNEERSIGQKIDNLLALDYPSDRLQIIVVSDGSTDGTDAVVASYAGRNVLLVKQAQSEGKAAALNAGAKLADGELLLFCDVRQRVDFAALKNLVQPFADPQVGAASGELCIDDDQGPGVYWKYEKLIRQAESDFDSVVGATGAFFAIRRQLYRQLPIGTLLDDVYTPMQIALRGYRVLLEPTAKIFDRESHLAGEFARKARTLAGNYQLLTQLPSLLSPLNNRLFLQFLSHKVLRLACPFALATLFASNVVLVATGAPPWPLYVATLAAQMAGYGLAAQGALAGENAGRLARISHTFVTLNVAAVDGLRRFIGGDLSWTTQRDG